MKLTKLGYLPITLGIWAGVIWNPTGSLGAERRPMAPSRSSYYRAAYVPTVAVVPGPKRGHRPIAVLAAPALHVVPRYVMPGSLAPWGSIPPAYYAASYPLVLADISADQHRVSPLMGGLSSPGNENVSPHMEQYEAPAAPRSDRGANPPDSTRTVSPELIPTPQPVEKEP